MSGRVVIIGAGPAGLMAADIVSAAGYPVDIHDAMPSPGRKFLRAGVGGLNLTHSEALPEFSARYSTPRIADWLARFGPAAVRQWAHSLGIDTFVGSSGRVFPVQMKAAPLLRAWLRRLADQSVRLHLRQGWQGWDSEGNLDFMTPNGARKVSRCDTAATVLALGGGSWSRLGSDARWIEIFRRENIAIAPLQPANCGFTVAWSAHLREHFAGQPLKAIAASIVLPDGQKLTRAGECVVSQHGLEGGLIYALSAPLREQITCRGYALLQLDLSPQRSRENLLAALSQPRGRDSLANHLRRRAGIEGVKAALLRECATPEQLADPAALAGLIKALPVRLDATRPLDEAISTAGGVCLNELDAGLMLKKLPGVFCAGEMLDWEAPTGGYLLTACLASGVVAGQGILDHLARRSA